MSAARLAAQQAPVPKGATGTQAGTLVVEPQAELHGAMYRLGNVMTCVGNASDPKAYGVKWTGLDFKATHLGVPMGAQVYVTVASTGKKGFGNLQGARVNYVLKSSGLSLVVPMARTSQPGPTCETPVGSEPAPIPSKAMPQEETSAPLLDGMLKVLPSATVTSPIVTFYTTAGSPHFLDVAGVPTHWRFTSSTSPPSASSFGWSSANIVGWGRIAAMTVSLTNDGKQTLYLYLKNAAGVSPGYPVEVTYLDMRPCTFSLRSWNGSSIFASSSSTTNTYSVARSSNKGFAGDGMNVSRWTNTGPHTVVIGYTVGDYNTTSQQAGVKADTLPPGAERGPATTYEFGHVKHATCP
ncbi:MAG: hypothetical protein IT360_07050 [Gemmatimonadaceae bacterium]|nr:hypothetical protein [Gemmatimonadaceae bacterium]